MVVWEKSRRYSAAREGAKIVNITASETLGV